MEKLSTTDGARDGRGQPSAFITKPDRPQSSYNNYIVVREKESNGNWGSYYNKNDRDSFVISTLRRYKNKNGRTNNNK